MTISSYRLPIILALIIILIFISTSFAQFTIKYEMTIPNELGSFNDWSVDDEGNVFVAGWIGMDNYSLWKIDTAGEITWQRNLYGPTPQICRDIIIVVGHDGNPVVAYTDCDYTFIPPDSLIITSSYLAVVKYDSDGNILWGPMSIPQELSCGPSMTDMAVDEDGYVYMASGESDDICSKVHVISPEGSLQTCQLNNFRIRGLLATSSSAFVTGKDLNTVYCQDPGGPLEEWYNTEWRMLLIKVDQSGSCVTTFGPWGDHQCDINQCENAVYSQTSAGLAAQADPYGSIAVPIGVSDKCIEQGIQRELQYISWFGADGSQIDIFEADIENLNLLLVDHSDNIYVPVKRDYISYIDKLSPEGSVLWEVPGGLGGSVLDVDGYLYGLTGTSIRCLNPNDGSTEWECPVSPFGQSIYIDGIQIDDEKQIYVFHHTYPNTFPYGVSVYESSKKLTILDGSEDNDPIADTKFWLIRMQNDIPNLTEDTLGQFTTDENGEFELNIVDCGEFEFVHDLYNGSTSDIISVGDSLKIAKHVYSKDAVKHTDLLGTMYSLHLDNAIFKINGEMVFDTLDNMAKQEIVVNHTEFRYNLVASVEWDTKINYLTILEENMQYMSNFLYDITDGQLRLDTVRIYDDKEHWFDADIRINADNMIRPHCRNDIAGIIYPSASGQGREIIMPRKWFGNRDASRNNTEADNIFYSLERRDYRTKAHEFGHYALGFYDEYVFWDDESDPPKYRQGDDLKCASMQSGNYGFMENHYSHGEPFASEMSSRYRYEDSECQNTEHFRRYNKSCWDHFEAWVEAFTWGSDNMYVPLLKPDLDDPDERHDIGTNFLFTGPNNDLADLDYDVGSMIHFTETPNAPNPGIENVHIKVSLASGGNEADVFLINSPNDPEHRRYIIQGQTADNEHMIVLGVKTAENDHIIQGSKAGRIGQIITKSNGSSTSPYACGIATAGKSGVSKVGNSFSSTPNADTLEIELRTIEGDYPIIVDVDLSESQLEYTMHFTTQFQSNPTLDVLTGYGHQNSYSLNPVGNAYSQMISDSLGDNGCFTTWAVDESAEAFFFINDYTVSNLDLIGNALRITGSGGHCELLLDTLNSSIQRAVIVSSSYPVPTDGFIDEVVKAGKTHSVSYYPNGSLNGDNQIYIFYSDGDLVIDSTTLADENSLCIYKWNSTGDLWENLGGSVDTSLNYVTETISGPGMYAAFSTDFITDVSDGEHGDILPYRFELSQNYPNPFNPVTTISYSLPRRSEISIDIFNILGQKIITLVSDTKPAGDYQINWSGDDSNGLKVSTGIYFYRFQAGDYIETKKMILLK